MKSKRLLMLALVAPALLVAPVCADEAGKPVVEKEVKAKAPTLTFYYFDG